MCPVMMHATMKPSFDGQYDIPYTESPHLMRMTGPEKNSSI